MPVSLHWLRYAWLPALVLAAGALLHFRLLPTPALLVPQLPYLLLGAALVLGIYFQLSRIAYAAALLLAAWGAGGLLSLPVGHPLSALTAALLALNLALVSPAADRSLFSGFGLLLLVAAGAQALSLLVLHQCCGGWLASPVSAGGLLFSKPELLFGCALVLALGGCLFSPDHTRFSLLAVILLLAALYLGGFSSGALLLAASAGGLLLLLLVLRTAYELAFRDELTGIPSRRAYERYLLTLGRRYSIAVVDIDHFKKLNDRHGHQVGDQALRMVAARIARYGGGRAFRYGGEEFVVVLRGRTADQASHSLEKMREKIAGYALRLRAASRPGKSDGRARSRRGQGAGAKSLKTTVSIGLASSGGGLKSPQEVMRAADAALYRAKRAGRNRLCVHGARG